MQNGGSNMLLEFKTKNYKSFTEETLFSMVAAPKQSGLDYSLLKQKIKTKTIKVLCSSVIYGPNAAGKTNIIGAMDVLRAIVLRGNIRNSEERSSPNLASSMLELIPNKNIDQAKPVEFSIDFVEQGLLIHYAISIDLGLFLDEDYSREILSEVLSVNGEEVYSRNGKLSFGNFKNIKTYMTDAYKHSSESVIKISRDSLNREELFLTNGFKLLFSKELVKLIIDWFANKFMVIYRADSMQIIKRFVDPQKQTTVYVETTTNKAAEIFGIHSNVVGYVVGDDDVDAKLCSIFEKNKDQKGIAIAAEMFESYGTIRFINLFPLVIRAIQTGGTLIVDEFDASIHPMALMNIVNAFHNDEINIRQAQLVFNTHNPIFLNSNLFRRDEIKFVERNDTTDCSGLYALSDFGTSGENGVRKHEDYMKNYFISQYGAIKDIDFTPVFEELFQQPEV